MCRRQAQFGQDLSQLRSTYGEHGAGPVLANFRTQVYHPTDDLATAKLISERSGRFDFGDWSSSRSRRPFSATNDSVKRSDRPLITPVKVMNQMHPDEVITFTRGTVPIRAHRLKPNSVVAPPLAPPPLLQLKTPRLRMLPPSGTDAAARGSSDKARDSAKAKPRAKTTEQ